MVYISTNLIIANFMKNIKDIFTFCIYARPNFAKTKREANGKFLPKPLLFHLRHPNSKKINQPKFCGVLSPKNCLRKTSSVLFQISSGFSSKKVRILSRAYRRLIQKPSFWWLNPLSIRVFSLPNPPKITLYHFYPIKEHFSDFLLEIKSFSSSHTMFEPIAVSIFLFASYEPFSMTFTIDDATSMISSSLFIQSVFTSLLL